MQYYFDTTRQYNFIKSIFKEDLYRNLAERKAFIAGGAISSIFTGRSVNDWDIFFPTKIDSKEINKISSDANLTCIFKSDLAETYNYKPKENSKFSLQEMNTSYGVIKIINESKLQFVTEYFGPPEVVLQEFDFHCCMGAFSFANNEFYFDKFFISDNMSKEIRFNYNGCQNPISALIRLEKYKKYGYSISNKELFKIIFGIKNIRLETIKDFNNLLKRINNNEYRTKLIKTIIINPLAKMRLNFNTPEGDASYKEFMESKLNLDDVINALGEINN